MKPASIPHDVFCAKIAELIAASPVEFEGRLWAAWEQDALAGHLGISVSTLKRYIRQPPDVRKYVAGKRVLLRIGEPDPPTFRDVAQIMSGIFKQVVGRTPSRKEYGCLVGLAGIWPEGEQIEIFKHTLKQWSAFMAYAGAWQELENTKATSEGEAPIFQKPYLGKPSRTFLRVHHLPALELYADDLQAAKKAPSEAIKQAFPGIWPVYPP